MAKLFIAMMDLLLRNSEEKANWQLTVNSGLDILKRNKWSKVICSSMTTAVSLN
jgi:hypothetical protein